ncbi:hypothetical protein [Actinacidiphila sp. ITFR-21]|uniref:hypothetical protein n=1 Tax=Actinacidiphila sp. ITFR-21 TaxID=3075199 RepID=UPI00288B9A1B|nr:hypothetical protein [Streptomyces sp. ITFR-21]WNI17608.1 hypothetical protein RLT57_20175 [Streptomyces sp. ITFR-21]WNI17748.1 hypothetical protein RLT57_20890 [Streptomyces sp. ITFR-21]
MGVYELDIYSKTLYGAPAFVAFDSTVFVEQRGFGALEVTWGAPVQAAASQILAGVKAWTKLRLIRNSYGVPDTEDDGWVVLETSAGTDTGTFLDDTVVPGRVYYYGVFVSTAPDTWDYTITYYPGDLVTYNSGVYISIKAGPGAPPDLNPTYWTLSGISEQWVRCGGGVGLAVAEFGNSLLLYDNIPRPYKVETVESTASSIPVNEQLARFCSLFGYFFDVMKCEHDQLLRLNDVLQCTDRQVTLLAQQMGIADRLPTLPELRRTYVRDAALIQRDRGSTASTAALVRAITGWDADVSIGYNELHDLDEASFASPQFPAWARDTVYSTTAGSQLYSDIVQYGGELYAAIGTPRRESAYLSYTGSNPVRTGAGTIVRDPDQVADPYPGYVHLDGAAPGDTMTFTFNAASGGAGSYNVLLVAVGDPAGGIVTATVNGAAVTMPPLDLYSPSRQLIPISLIGNYSLTPTGNTLKLTVTGKNALSTGYGITASYWMIQGGGINLNVPPTGDPLSATYWQALTPNSLQDTLTEQNPLTGGYGSWNLSISGGATNPDVSSGLSPDWWISPQGARSGTSSPGTGNALNYTAKTAAGTREVFLSGPVKAPAWDPTNTYFAGQAVVWNPLGWSKPPVYMAKAQSVGRQPDLNPDKWAFTPYSANTSPEISRIITDSIYTPKVISWSATRSYRQGDRIAWRGHLYEAALPSLGIFPTGYNTDNQWWRWCGLNSQRYTVSLYHNRTATASGEDVRIFINFYNSYGVFGGTGFLGSDAQLLYDRFELHNFAYPQSTGNAPAGYVKPAAGQQGVPIPWNVSYGTWSNGRGVVRPTAWNSTSDNEKKAGRILWFYRNWVYDPPSGHQGEQLYVTFMSAPDNSAGLMEHGVVFRYNATNYWLASRDRLTYTQLTFTSGAVTGVTVTEVATWTPVQSGERFRVRNRAADILVESRIPGQSWRTLATVSDTRNNSALGWGLLERLRS